MDSTKRSSSSSPPFRRPSKTRDFRSISNIYQPKFNSLQNSPGAANALRSDYFSKDILQSSFTAESPTNPSTSHCSSDVNTVAPSEMSFLLQSHEGLQDMSFNNIDGHSNISSHVTDTSMNRASVEQPSDSIYHAYSGHYGSETRLPTCKIEDGYLMDFGSQEHGSFDQDCPYMSGFDQDPTPIFNNFNLELRPASFIPPMSNSFFDVAPQQDDPTSPQLGDGNLMIPGDYFSVFNSSVHDYPLAVQSPQKSKTIEFCSPISPACMKSALEILQALHIPPRTCLWVCEKTSRPSLRQPRLIDAVLSTNKDIVNSVSNMLKCTCSLSSQLQLILTIICGKVIAWYRAIIRNDHSPGDLSMLSSTASKSTNDDDYIERILHQPITVGRYSFDGTLESKIRTQVVYNELQHLETMIETLSGRIQGVNFGANTSYSGENTFGIDSESMKPEERGRAETIRTCLSAFLREQLQAAKDEPDALRNIERGQVQDSNERRGSCHSR